MEMKRIAIALGILITTTAIGSASAAEMPKEFRGTWWCADRPGWSPRTHSPWPAGSYRRCHKVTDADDAFGIDASGREWGHDMVDDTCKVLRVTSYGKGHFVVRARCNNGRVLLRWRLFNSGRRLEIRDAAPAKAQDLTMLEDRFGLPVFPDRAQRPWPAAARAPRAATPPSRRQAGLQSPAASCRAWATPRCLRRS
jgi:hypothetical protein